MKNLTTEQLTAVLFAVREQAHQTRTVAVERRRAANDINAQAERTGTISDDAQGRMCALFQSARGLEEHAMILDAAAISLGA
jgi:hypothetical protein